MRDKDRRKYGRARLSLDQGGFGRRPAPSPSRPELIDLADRVRAKFALCRSVRGTVPSRAVQLIIEGYQKPLSSSGKRALEMLDAGVPVPAIKAAVALELAQWIDEQAARRGRPDPDPVSAALNLRKYA